MKNLKYIMLAFIVLLCDQLSKWAVTEYIITPLIRAKTLGRGEANDFFEWLLGTPSVLPYTEMKVAALFNIVMVWNRGISFGLFNNNVDYAPYFLVTLSVIIITWFSVFMFKTKSTVQKFSIALIIGGALGNVIDRLRFGAVIDFLDFHIYGYHWPAFNIADSVIVIGVIILALHMFFFEKTVQTKRRTA